MARVSATRNPQKSCRIPVLFPALHSCYNDCINSSFSVVRLFTRSTTPLICPYIEEYFADEKNMAEYQKLKASGKLSQNSHTFNAQKAVTDRMPDFVVVKFR